MDNSTYKEKIGDILKGIAVAIILLGAILPGSVDYWIN